MLLFLDTDSSLWDPYLAVAHSPSQAATQLTKVPHNLTSKTPNLTHPDRVKFTWSLEFPSTIFSTLPPLPFHQKRHFCKFNFHVCSSLQANAVPSPIFTLSLHGEHFCTHECPVGLLRGIFLLLRKIFWENKILFLKHVSTAFLLFTFLVFCFVKIW